MGHITSLMEKFEHPNELSFKLWSTFLPFVFYGKLYSWSTLYRPHYRGHAGLVIMRIAIKEMEALWNPIGSHKNAATPPLVTQSSVGHHRENNHGN